MWQLQDSKRKFLALNTLYHSQGVTDWIWYQVTILMMEIGSFNALNPLGNSLLCLLLESGLMLSKYNIYYLHWNKIKLELWGTLAIGFMIRCWFCHWTNVKVTGLFHTCHTRVSPLEMSINDRNGLNYLIQFGVFHESYYIMNPR